MTGRIANYALNWRDVTEYEVAIVNRRGPFREVEWLEGPEQDHREWMHKAAVSEYCLPRPAGTPPHVRPYA
jgi:hypothetical protein